MGYLKKYVNGNSSYGPDKSNSHMQDDTRSPRSAEANETSQGEGSKGVWYMLNTIVRGFIRAGETIFARRRCTFQILNAENLNSVEEKGDLEMPEATSTFYENGATVIHPHNDGPMIIIVRCDEWEIKRVLVSHENFAHTLYQDAFERLHLDLENLKPFKG